MKTSAPRIEPTLLRILNSREGMPFTRTELLNEYRALANVHGRNKASSRQFINRNLLRLEKSGILSRVDDGPDQVQKYQFRQPPKPEKTTPTKGTLVFLRQKLQQQRIELLSTIGETEAYDEICVDLPQLRPTVQTQYDEARDRSVKLLGRIRALEALIDIHGEKMA